MIAYRSLLFVKASDGASLVQAFASGADAVVADLEDAVPPGREHHARDLVADALARVPAGPARLVRVNALDTPAAVDDLALVASLELDALVVPKSTPEALATLPPDGLPVVAVVETAAGIRHAYEIASHPRVHALALGANDLSADLGLDLGADAAELLYSRSKLVVDGVAAGVRSLVDRVYPVAGDAAGLAADARAGRALGYRGKSTLTAGDVKAINRVFASTGPMSRR